MQTHRLRRYASAVLAAFIATVCVALLAPFADEAGFQLVCSVAGSKRIATGAVDGSGGAPAPLSDTHAGGAVHCPLCVPVSPPPSFVAWVSTPVQPDGAVTPVRATAAFTSVVGAPFPARGPPVLS